MQSPPQPNRLLKTCSEAVFIPCWLLTLLPSFFSSSLLLSPSISHYPSPSLLPFYQSLSSFLSLSSSALSHFLSSFILPPSLLLVHLALITSHTFLSFTLQSRLPLFPQEFGVDRLSDLAIAYDLVIGQVVGNIRRAVEKIVDLFNGELSLAELFQDFDGGHRVP